MTTLAILFMSLALIFVAGLAAWCYYKVLTSSRGSDED